MQVLQPLQLMPQLVCCCRQLSLLVQISAWWQLRANTCFLLQLRYWDSGFRKNVGAEKVKV